MQINLRALLIMAGVSTLLSCSNGDKDYDAAGNFEADEILVSAQQNGILQSFTIREGDALQANAVVGQIDVTMQQLQKEQMQAAVASLQQKTTNADAQVEVVRRQLEVQQSQLKQLQRERTRVENLVKAEAAPKKQLDDINANVEQLQNQIAASQAQIEVYTNTAATHNRSVLSERAPMQKNEEQIQVQIDKGTVINPVNGVVLTKYAMQGEMAAIGKPLYKIANVDTLTLKAYITGDQLPNIKLQQPVTVRIDDGKSSYKNYSGRIYYIANKAEFTPKTIQTKNERANLVYAIKVAVKNDGYLKIGMYGEVILQANKK